MQCSNTKSVYPPFLVDINALHAVNSQLVSVAPKWMDLGLSLGLDKPILDSLESNYPRDVNRCLTETLAKWLQQVRTARSWRTITHALMASSINRADLAHSVAMKHGMCQTGFVFCFCPFFSFFFLFLYLFFYTLLAPFVQAQIHPKKVIPGTKMSTVNDLVSKFAACYILFS